MAKVHPIEAELSKALGIKRGAKEREQTFAKKLHEAATADETCPETIWDQLTDAAQAWVNACTDAVEAGALFMPGYGDSDEVGSGVEPDDGKSSKSKKSGEGKAPGIPKVEKSSKTKNPKAVGEKGYKGHRPGSRKEKIHKMFDEKGAEAAMKLALKLEIKEGSAKNWISGWGGKKAKG